MGTTMTSEPMSDSGTSLLGKLRRLYRQSAEPVPAAARQAESKGVRRKVADALHVIADAVAPRGTDEAMARHKMGEPECTLSESELQHNDKWFTAAFMETLTGKSMVGASDKAIAAEVERVSTQIAERPTIPVGRLTVRMGPTQEMLRAREALNPFKRTFD